MVIPLQYLLGLGAAIFAAFIYLKTKKDSAEALNENIDTKNQINEIDKQVAKNDGELQSEEDKRKQLEKEAEDAKNANQNVSSLIDFFSKRKG